MNYEGRMRMVLLKSFCPWQNEANRMQKSSQKTGYRIETKGSECDPGEQNSVEARTPKNPWRCAMEANRSAERYEGRMREAPLKSFCPWQNEANRSAHFVALSLRKVMQMMGQVRDDGEAERVGLDTHPHHP